MAIIDTPLLKKLIYNWVLCEYDFDPKTIAQLNSANIELDDLVKMDNKSFNQCIGSTKNALFNKISSALKEIIIDNNLNKISIYSLYPFGITTNILNSLFTNKIEIIHILENNLAVVMSATGLGRAKATQLKDAALNLLDLTKDFAFIDVNVKHHFIPTIKRHFILINILT